jgi:hypothetical protein
LIVGITDLELANWGQAPIVVDVLRKALNDCVSAMILHAPDEAQLRDVLRDRCSFHLLAPMVEGYFFAEHGALARAGVSNPSCANLRSQDVEDFEAVEPDVAWSALCQRMDAQRHALGKTWWNTRRHPKHYLEFLIGRVYDEVSDGKRALRTLDWPSAGRDPSWAPFARSLFQDLADWFDVACPLAVGATSPSTYPGPRVRRDTLCLRNL